MPICCRRMLRKSFRTQYSRMLLKSPNLWSSSNSSTVNCRIGGPRLSRTVSIPADPRPVNRICPARLARDQRQAVRSFRHERSLEPRRQLVHGEAGGFLLGSAEKKRRRVLQDPPHRAGPAEAPVTRSALDLHRVVRKGLSPATRPAGERADEVHAMIFLVRHARNRAEHAEGILGEVLRPDPLVQVRRDRSWSLHAHPLRQLTNNAVSQVTCQLRREPAYGKSEPRCAVRSTASEPASRWVGSRRLMYRSLGCRDSAPRSSEQREPPLAWPGALSPLAAEVCRSGESGAGRAAAVRSSDVIIFVPQLVSQAARRGDRLDGEAFFEAA